MILHKLSILNYKNIKAAELRLSPGMNCFIGSNGAGKTNVIDAVYYLSFCRSALCAVDSQVMRHGEAFFMLEGSYQTDGGDPLSVYCGMKRGTKKHMKRDGKEYRRLSEHIGLVPLVSVSPADSLLIDGGSEERRRLMDIVISQYDRAYLDSLGRYNKALAQRNAMLRADAEPDPELIGILEEQMAVEGEAIFARREAFVSELEPVFREFYDDISAGHESVGLAYESHCRRGPLLDVIQRDRVKDRIMGYSLHGIHRDELDMRLDGYPIRREGSQGQAKSFLVALKFAQLELLKRVGRHTVPLLLLDDIFDKLDAGRVAQIVNLVAGDGFGQIFITDTNRDHLDSILAATQSDYRLFNVKGGEVSE